MSGRRYTCPTFYRGVEHSECHHFICRDCKCWFTKRVPCPILRSPRGITLKYWRPFTVYISDPWLDKMKHCRHRCRSGIDITWRLLIKGLEVILLFSVYIEYKLYFLKEKYSNRYGNCSTSQKMHISKNLIHACMGFLDIFWCTRFNEICPCHKQHLHKQV